MIYSILDVGEWLLTSLSWLAPITIVIIAVIFTAAITRGYRGMIQGIVDITKSKWSFFFFIIVVCLMLYFWNQLKNGLGW